MLDGRPPQSLGAGYCDQRSREAAFDSVASMLFTLLLWIGTAESEPGGWLHENKMLRE